MAAQDLIFRFLGIDAGAGHQFDRMAGKATMAEGALASLAAGAVAVGAVIAVASIKSAATFQTEMTKLQTQAGQSAGHVKQLSAAVLGLSGSTATAPSELARGLYHLVSAGLPAAKQMQALRVAAEGAKLGGANLEDVTNALNAAISSGIPGVHDMSQAMGYLNATVGSGDMRMQDLADALTTGVLPVVRHFGLTMRDASAALAVFGDNNMRGATAGTALRMVVQSLAAPSATATKILNALGLQTDSLAKDMQHGGLNQALRDLAGHLHRAGVSSDQVGQVITKAFGRKSSAGLTLLVGEMGKWNQKFAEVDHGAKGFAASWAGYTKTFQFRFDQMRQSVERLSIKLGLVLLPAATAFAKYITTHVLPGLQTFGQIVGRDVVPVVRSFAHIVGGAVHSALGSISQGFGTAGNAVKTFGGVFKLIAPIVRLWAYDLAFQIKAAGFVLEGIGYAVRGVEFAFKKLASFFTGPFVAAIGDMESFFLRGVKGIADVWLAAVGVIIRGAADAFGWVPGVGGKLKSAASEFDAFRSAVDIKLSALANDAASLGAAGGSAYAANFASAANSVVVNPTGQPVSHSSGIGSNPKQAQPGYVASVVGGVSAGVKLAAPKLSSTLADALAGPGGSTGTKVGNSVASHIDKALQAHMAKFKADLANARQFQASLTSTLTGFAALSGNTSGTDVLGASGAAPSTQSYLRGKARSLEKFAHLLRRLDQMGLSRNLLEQFANIGPDAIPAMQELLHSGRRGIRTADRLERQVERYAGQAATMVTRDHFGNQLHKDLEKLPDKIARAIEHKLRHLNIITDTGKQDRKNGHKVRTS